MTDSKTEKEAMGGSPAGSGGGPPGAGEGHSSGGIPMAALMTLIAGAFMGILDGSIVNVALPRMMSIFNSTADQIQWVMTGYLLASGVVVPVTGYLSDRFGGKRLYVVSLGVFTAGSALCSLAWSNNSLVAARVVQAVGGGMMMPVSMAMIYHIVPRDKIGTALGIWGISAMVAPTVGPTLGGYLVDNFSWHWIFTINVPIGVAAVFLAMAILEETPKKTGLKVDIPGIVLSAAGCFALLLALSEGQDKGWTSLYIVNLLIFSGFTLALFVVWELITEQPMLDIRLLKNRTFAASLLCVSIATIGLFSAIFLVPLFVQNVLGFTPMQTGLMMMPAALASGIMMPVSGRLFDKVGALPLCLVGLSVTVVTTYQLHTITYDVSYRDLQHLLVVRSLGLGLCMMPIATAGMNTIPHFLIGRASALSNLVRQISASFGIAFLTYVMLNRQEYHAVRLADTVSYNSPAAAGALQQIQGLLSQAGAGASGAAGVLYSLVRREAFISGIADAFVVSTVIVILAMPFVFLLDKKRVEAQRALEYRRYAGMMPPGGPPAGGPAGKGGPDGAGASGRGDGIQAAEKPQPVEI
ncbi:MAG TPA: DHA2 family efflux MFS transporter permease subunit [Bacillota bacterium]|nr:DHA2 family efflux MFS transporter permease subunit [Bacillota bacterium]